MKNTEPVSETLFQLQAIDRSLHDATVESTQSDLVKEVASSEERLGKIRRITEVSAQKVRDGEIRLNRKELELAAVEDRISKSESQMFDGTVTDARGLSGLQTLIALEKEKKDELEQAVLTDMESMDQLKEQEAKAQTVLMAAERHHRQLLTRLDEWKAEMDKKMRQLREQRLEVRARLSDDVLKKYDQISANTPRPVARVVDRACSGCSMTVPTALKRPEKNEVSLCPHCSRLLFWE